MVESLVKIPINVVVADPGEAAPFIVMAKQLNDVFSIISENRYLFELNFFKGLQSEEIKKSCGILAISMSGELNRLDVACSDAIDDYSHRVSSLISKNPSPGFVCTIFRYVPLSLAKGQQKKMMERIARLNFMAVCLSQATGISVIDIDRSLAHYGARELNADFTLTSSLACYLAGDTMVSTILAEGLAHVVSDEHLQEARVLHGDRFAQQERLSRVARQLAVTKFQKG